MRAQHWTQSGTGAFLRSPAPGKHDLGADYNGPRTEEYDRLLLSAAHYAVAVYAALVEVGRRQSEELLQHPRCKGIKIHPAWMRSREFSDT